MILFFTCSSKSYFFHTFLTFLQKSVKKCKKVFLSFPDVSTHPYAPLEEMTCGQLYENNKIVVLGCVSRFSRTSPYFPRRGERHISHMPVGVKLLSWAQTSLGHWHPFEPIFKY